MVLCKQNNLLNFVSVSAVTPIEFGIMLLLLCNKSFIAKAKKVVSGIR